MLFVLSTNQGGKKILNDNEEIINISGLFESQEDKINLNSVIGLAVSLIIMRELLPIALTAIRPSNWFVRLYYRIKYFFKKWIFQIIFWTILGSEILLVLLIYGGVLN